MGSPQAQRHSRIDKPRRGVVDHANMKSFFSLMRKTAWTAAAGYLEQLRIAIITSISRTHHRPCPRGRSSMPTVSIKYS